MSDSSKWEWEQFYSLLMLTLIFYCFWLQPAFIALLTLWPTDPAWLALTEPKLLSHTYLDNPDHQQKQQSHRETHT